MNDQATNAATKCPACTSGNTGPVHLRFADGHGEWRESSKCSHCNGTGTLSADRAQAYRVGETMREARRLAGVTLRAEAARLGISPATLSDREWGRIDPATEREWEESQ